MRIANNIMAMNTHRSYTANNEAVQASAEKLSSGYRINRAGDDAAGLAISEKMRSQIRGLNMATKNSQDAVSLIQTAEGALQEVHSMLQRMNELAVQSATGTNETFDRTQIAKEFEQLKREINDISEQTTFNNMNLLDGSLSAAGLNRTAYTSGVYSQFEQDDPTNAPGAIKSQTITEGTPFVAGYSASFSIDIKDATVAGTAGTMAAASITLSVGGQQVDSAVALASKAVGQNYTGSEVAAAFVGSTVTIDNVSYTATVNGSKITFTADAAADVTEASLKTIEFSGNGATGKASDIAPGKADQAATIAKSSFEFDWESAKSGDKFTVGDKTFTFFDSINDENPLTTTGSDFNIDLQQVTSASALATQMNAALGADVNVTAAGNTVNLEYAGTLGSNPTASNNTFGQGAGGVKGNDVVKIDSQPVEKKAEGTTTFELDTAKMKVGDKISYTTDAGTTVTHTFKEGDTAKDIATTFGIQDQIDGNTWSVKGELDQSSRLEFKAADDFKEYDTMKIQVGALEGEQLNIKISAMNTAGLGLDDAGIFDQKSAGKAITATRDAINQVSDQRALLGAMQNRMTHKIANLKVSTENLSAAESRIRDVDMASEMTNFTKNNILSQAATAMLAQANSAPQNVLSLLR